VGALREERQRRVRGVAHDADAACRETIQRLPPQQRPFVGRIDIADDRLYVMVPVAQVVQALLARAGLGPGFQLPVVAFHHADEVQQLPAPQRIGDDMAADTHPVGAHQPLLVRRQAFHRHQAAPCHDAGELRASLPEYLLADARMHAVGADQHVAGRLFAVGEMQGDAVRCLRETDAAIAGVDRLRRRLPHGVEQDGVEIAAMRHPVGRAEALHRCFAEVEDVPALAGAAEADFLGGRGADHAQHRRFKAERDEETGAVGAKLDAGADFAQLAGLLEYAHVEAAAEQGERHGEAAEAGTGDQHAQLHAVSTGRCYAWPRSSRQSDSMSCTGRSEKLNSTASFVALWTWRCQLGTTNRSRGFQRKTVSPMVVSPSPSTTEYTVPSVERYGAERKPPGKSCMNAPMVGIGALPEAGLM